MTQIHLICLIKIRLIRPIRKISIPFSFVVVCSLKLEFFFGLGQQFGFRPIFVKII